MEDIQYLVFSGGGMPALYAFSGALQELTTIPQFSFNKLKGVAGSSIGSVVGLFIALNYTPKQAYDKLCTIDFTKFRPKHFLKSAFTLFKQYSMLDKGLIYNVILNGIKEKFPGMNPETVTFRDLHDKGFKDLYVNTTKMYELYGKTVAKEKIFSYETTPDTSVALAVYASTSAPFLFPKLHLKKVAPGKYVESPDGHLYDDGGLMNNLQIELFDKLRYIPELKLSDIKDRITNPHVLGLDLDITDEFKDGKIPEKKVINFWHLYKYAKGLLRSGVTFDKKNLNKENKNRTILIDRLEQTFYAFKMSDEIKHALYEAGRKSVQNYFAPRVEPKLRLSS